MIGDTSGEDHHRIRRVVQECVDIVVGGQCVQYWAISRVVEEKWGESMIGRVVGFTILDWIIAYGSSFGAVLKFSPTSSNVPDFDGRIGHTRRVEVVVVGGVKVHTGHHVWGKKIVKLVSAGNGRVPSIANSLGGGSRRATRGQLAIVAILNLKFGPTFCGRCWA